MPAGPVVPAILDTSATTQRPTSKGGHWLGLLQSLASNTGIQDSIIRESGGWSVQIERGRERGRKRQREGGKRGRDRKTERKYGRGEEREEKERKRERHTVVKRGMAIPH